MRTLIAKAAPVDPLSTAQASISGALTPSSLYTSEWPSGEEEESQHCHTQHYHTQQRLQHIYEQQQQRLQHKYEEQQQRQQITETYAEKQARLKAIYERRINSPGHNPRALRYTIVLNTKKTQQSTTQYCTIQYSLNLS
jgi:hypothetical protein